MAANILLLTTIAEVEESNNHYEIRKKEYYDGIHKLLSYSFPVIGVVSETNKINVSVISDYKSKFNFLHEIPSTDALSCYSKSSKEYVSMKKCMETYTQTNTINDETWIIKTSGRYLLTDDSFIQTVKNAPDTCNFVGKLCDENRQIYTFCYAMRYKYFKMFLSESPFILARKNIELYILEFLHKLNIFTTSQFISMLGIYASIANTSPYATF